MTDRVKIDWLVPTPEWERFRDYVHDEHGSINGHLGEEAETAMIEFAGLDEYASVESKVHSLVEAAGREPFKEKNSENGDDIATGEKTRVSAKVKPEVKAGFKEELRHTENKPGVDFARAIRQYRQHPRAERINDELDRVLDDAERLLGELNSDEDGSEKSMSLAERKTVAIIDDLRDQGCVDQFTDDELVDTIECVADVSSEPSIKKYRRLVVDRLGMERHPKAPHVWIPHDVADEIASGEPQEIRQPVDRLDRGERVRRIQLAVGRAAAERDTGQVRVQTPAVEEQILDEDVERTTTLSLMRGATLPAGITIDDDTSPATLEVDFDIIQEVDSDLAEAILLYRDETESGLLDGPTASTMHDFIGGPGEMPAENQRAFSDGGSTHRWNEYTGKPRMLRDDEDEPGGGGGE